ncbi:MAG: hypothetical protein ACI9FB_001141 [Candidatus Azotimanducaceae bacterium]|jgi:hypothetical protein
MTMTQIISNKPVNWHAQAFNPSEDSENQIHSDEMAKAYGFKGGLVPGVTVSSYLMHPALSFWGKTWLDSGYAKVVVHKPLYDGYQFEIEVKNSSNSQYEASLIDEKGTCCATALINIEQDLEPAPTLRGDPTLSKGQEVPAATRENMEILMTNGMYALPAKWSQKTNMSTYLKDASAMPALHNFSSDVEDGAYANGSFMLGLSNWVLAGNAYMNPWIHLQTESRYFAAVTNNTDLIVECNIEDLFEKKGHEFVDLKVNVFDKNSAVCVMTTKLRAIYKLRVIE